MKKFSVKKLALAGMFCALCVVGSVFSFPMFGSKCAPVQHMVNVLCAVLLFGFSLVNIVWPKRTQLELENRKAAQLPAFSVSALLDGSWQSGFARWMQDQFAFRDAAVNTQRAADEVLFRKAEEGGILRSSAQVRPGDRIELRLAQGSLGCRVEEVEGEETHGKENL